MEFSMSCLKAIYDRCAEYSKYLKEGGWMAQRDDTSPFWAKIFQEKQRINYPGFDDMLFMRRRATYPLADSQAGINPEVEYDRAKAAYDVVSQSVPGWYFQGLRESPVGCPLCFEFKGRMFSAGGIINALTSYRILQWCDSSALSARPLRILEIGAGYGQVAYQLLQKLQITSYTVCDLPENLFLSAFYLQANFPERRAAFIGEDRVAADDQTGFRFLAPPFLTSLHGGFDLVINSYSFQEMNRANVEEYFAFVETRLANDGLFYSLNAHGKSGVVWPSEYPIERFKLISLLPVRKYPFQVFATNPYEVVMMKRTHASGSGEMEMGSKRQMDALGGALQLGLGEELLELSRKFVQRELDREEADWLNALCDFLHVYDYNRKKELLLQMRLTEKLPSVVAYLSGSLEFAVGHMELAEIDLREAVTGRPSSYAQVRSQMLLACLAHRSGHASTGEAIRLEVEQAVPHLTGEISCLVRDYETLADQVARQLYLDLSQHPLDFRRLMGRARRMLHRLHDSDRATRRSKAEPLTSGASRSDSAWTTR
jgi:putative sugar O-methyltransferase